MNNVTIQIVPKWVIYLRSLIGLAFMIGLSYLFDYIFKSDTTSFALDSFDFILVGSVLVQIIFEWSTVILSIDLLGDKIVVNRLLNRKRVIPWNQVLEIQKKDAGFLGKGLQLVIVYANKRVNQIGFTLKDLQLFHQLKSHLEAVRLGQEKR